jgi:predicted amidohydrolase YtcJ/regulation of enolase protein 1 (concanavalin A-like superfamily)
MMESFTKFTPARLSLSVTALLALVLACSLGPTATPNPLPSSPAPVTAAPNPPSTASLPRPAAQPAEWIITGGPILTMDPSQPTAEAVAVKDGRILAVGSAMTMQDLIGPETVQVDLQGRTLLPAFSDAHDHIFQRADELGPGLDEIDQTLFANGVTSSGEMYVDQTLLEALQALAQRGGLHSRLRLYLSIVDGCGQPTGDWWKAYTPGQELGPNLTVQGVKLFTDGGSCGAPAISMEYSNGVGQGDLWMSQDQMNAYVQEADALGFQVAIHALGDRGIDQGLNALAAVLNGGPNTKRHRLEHNAVLRDDQLARYGQIGVVPTLFGAFQTCVYSHDTGQFKYLLAEPDRKYEWRWRDLIDANPGLIMAWHSDYPILPIDIATNLYSLVTREQVDTDGSICQPSAAQAKQTITADEALHLMTSGSAYALGLDGLVGTLAPGKDADMVVLSDNPLTVDPEALKDLSVALTTMQGRVVFCSSEAGDLCQSMGGAGPAAVAPAATPSSPGFSDTFDTDSLDPGWTWVREKPDAWNLSGRPGWLFMDTAQGRLLFKGGDAPVLLREAPEGDFEATVKLDMHPTQDFQSAGLILYQDDDHFVSVSRAFCDTASCVGDGVYMDDDQRAMSAGFPNNAVSGLPATGPIYLKLVRKGTLITGYWSPDGSDWTLVAETEADLSNAKIGLYADNSRPIPVTVPAYFDDFTVSPLTP